MIENTDISNKEIKSKKNHTFIKELITLLKFSSISIASVILEYILFFFMVQILGKLFPSTSTKLIDGISTGVCYLLATIMCYVLNKIFVFKAKSRTKKEILIEGCKYYAIAFPKMMITSICVPLVISLLNIKLPILKTLINVVVQFVLFFVGYIFQKFWVFKNKKNEESTVCDSSEN